MKRLTILLLVLFVASLMLVPSASAGNGAPSGPHYNLNIIGVQHDKSLDPNWDSGNRIFVDLGTKDGEPANTKILLAPAPEGESYAVLDANGTDGTAKFQLPADIESSDGITRYSVFVRALGNPGGKATMQSCYTDFQTGDTWCAVDIAGGVEPILLDASKRPAKFENVTKNLLYVDVCLTVDLTTGDCLTSEVMPLFSDALDQYFWSYDNNGLKLAQLRFYQCATDVVDGSDTTCMVK